MVDPHDENGIALAIDHVLTEPETRVALVAAGEALARRHSWADTAASHAGGARARGRPVSEAPRGRRRRGLLRDARDLLRGSRRCEAEPATTVVVVDNASRDGSAAAVRDASRASG